MNWKRISQTYKARHKGMDFAAPTGTPVYAVADGKVVACSTGAWDWSYGKMVAIYHGSGNYTNYAHLSKIKVRLGQKVKAGQIIGLCGSTGNSTGPHLHFEVHKGKKWNRVNPKPYIDGIGKNANKYKVGKTYTLCDDMNVRISYKKTASRVGVDKWSRDAQKHATKDGLLKKGTKVTCLDSHTHDGSTWIRIPSGWVCAVGSSGTVFIK